MRAGLVAAALAAVLLAACAPAIQYRTLAEAQGSGAIEQGFLPGALPPGAALITIESDSGRPIGDYHFSSADYPGMVARFAPLARLPTDPLLQSWVKRKDLAGYQAYTSEEGARVWLLLCSQGKGRCYFRRLN